jgi:hypothetical protein
MDQQRRHDSLAPKGAFAADDANGPDLAAAQTATLVATDTGQRATTNDDDDTDAEISIFTLDHHSTDGDDLCADELIPVSTTPDTGRVSVEDSMRALIALRLERSRPSDDFGAFELTDPHDVKPMTAPASVPTDTRSTDSLTPIELTRVAPATVATHETRRLQPLPILAIAAVTLLGVGIYRRSHRAPTVPAPTMHAAAQAPAPIAEVAVRAVRPTPTAEDVAPDHGVATEIHVLDVSESEYATLTLGTPTIVNLPSTPGHAKRAVGRMARAAKAAEVKAETLSDVSPKTEGTAGDATLAPAPVASTDAVAPPDAPSRDAIMAGFNSVREQVLVCAHGSGGVAPIEATIVGDGHVIHASVGGYYQGTPEGSCIARALRAAQFAPFARESIKVAFPYAL